MAINEQTKITVPFANSGLRNDIPQTATGSNLASFEEGFPVITMTDIASGGQPPDGKDFNGILNAITKVLQYAQSGGLYKYDAAFAEAVEGYPLGAVLRSASGSKIWVNTSAGNATDPDNGGTNWVELTNASALDSAISAVEGLVSAEATARANAVSAEATARANAVSALQSSKQNNLTFDSTPTAGSSNPVTSGGIKTAIENIDALPSQSGHSGQYLRTDGETASWEDVESLPSQTGQSGKVLGTDGSSASWVSPPSGRNIGELVQSAIPLTDAGLHLLDGSKLMSGGVYDAFIQHINGLQATCPNLFRTQAEYDEIVAKNGSCGKFVVESDGVRLPKVSDILQGTTDLSAVGDLVEAGIPNIKSGLNFSVITFNVSEPPSDDGSPLYVSSVQSNKRAANGSNYQSVSIGIDAKRASKYYKDDVDKPTPQTIKSLLYICVATAVKTPVEANIDNVMTSVNNKADRDFANVTKPYVVEELHQGTEWYRIWSTGFVEQGGSVTVTQETNNKLVSFSVELLSVLGIEIQKVMSGTYSNNTSSAAYDGVHKRDSLINSVTSTGFKIDKMDAVLSNKVYWKAEGIKA